MTATSHVIYQHRQTGWGMLAVAALPFLCLLLIWLSTPPPDRSLPHGLAIGLCIASVLAVMSFGSMSITVTRDVVVARLGIGLIRRIVPLDDVARVVATRTHWIDGWGMHWTRRGMLYNVSGFDAVHFELRDGKALTFGSDDTTRLQSCIERALLDRARRR